MSKVNREKGYSEEFFELVYNLMLFNRILLVH